MKQTISVLSSFLLILSLLTGCWQDVPDLEEDLWPLDETEETVPSSGPQLPEVLSLPYAPDQSVDPIDCPDGMQQVLSSLMFEGLFRLNHALEPEPLLCSGYTYDAETLTYAFSLRTDALFSDGSALTAADVKATLERAAKSQRYGSRFRQVTRIRADGNTVIITLSEPNTAFPALLDIPIAKAESNTDIPIGSGPYLLAEIGGSHSLVASQNWWQGNHQPAEQIALVETADYDAMLYRFTSRDVHLITADLIGTDAVSVTGDIRYQDADTTILQYLGCNTAAAPLQSAAFRRALSGCLNRAQIVGAFLSGHGRAAQFPISPVCSLYPSELDVPYSGTAAVAPVIENYVSEQPLRLLVNNENRFKVSVSEYLAAAFTSAGIPVEVISLPWEEYITALTAGEFDFYYGEVKLTADWDLSALLASDGALNYGGWRSIQTDQLLAEYAAAEDRAAAMYALCSHLQSLSPIIPICFKSTSVLTQSGVVNGLAPTAAEAFYGLENCTVHLRPAE